MQDIIELERRIAAAFDRIDHGLETADRARAEAALVPAAPVEAATVAVPQNLTPPSESAQMGAMIRALETARDSSADWAARYAALEARMADETVAMAGQLAQLSADLDAKTQLIQDMETAHAGADTAQQQSTELQAMDDQMRDLRSQLVAQSAEMEALRSQRTTEIQELNAIIAALNPLIEEAENNA